MLRATKFLRRLLGRILLSFPRFIVNGFRFIWELFNFILRGGTVTEIYPILNDYKSTSGKSSGHYFYQDLIVAQDIFASGVETHYDVGSRVDGFVAHVASFTNIRVIDIRPPDGNRVPSVEFILGDITQGALQLVDSLSCLHTLEHFGLGRYGDVLDPHGHKKGFVNLVNSVKRGGVLWVSFPIASRPRVSFNAHRVLSANEIFGWPGAENIRLEKFWFINDSGVLDPEVSDPGLIPESHWACGIYRFRKK